MASIRELFDRGANEYDLVRRRLVPCLDDFYDAAVESSRWAWPDASAPVRVLDLGAGTGLLSAVFAHAFPQATFTLLDISDAMLEKARHRFAGRENQFSFHVLDYATAPLSGTYDLIISGLSIHHLSDADKQALFRRCYEALQSGGALVNADQVLGPTPAWTQRYLDQWRRQAQAAGATEPQLAEARERMRTDQPATLADQISWLASAGFQQVDCPYKNGMFAVIAGFR